jgi:hypothetical protein
MLIQFLSLVLTHDCRPILHAILSSFVRFCSIRAVVFDSCGDLMLVVEVENEALLSDM